MLSESQRTSGEPDRLHKSIFFWHEGCSSHCMLRIVVERATKQVVVVISSLASNQLNPNHISVDSIALVERVVKAHRSCLGDDLRAVTWLLHFGRFSEPLSYTTLHTPEVFVRPQIQWEGDTPLDEVSDETLSPAKLKTLYPWLLLPSIEEELRELSMS